MSPTIMLRCSHGGKECIEAQYTLSKLETMTFRGCGHRIPKRMYEKAKKELSVVRVRRALGVPTQKRIR